jgi:hypothetical protein
MKTEACNKLKRDVTNWPHSAELLELARNLVDETAESVAVLRERYRELRRCVGTAKSGKRCRAFTLWDCPERLCSTHYYKIQGPELTPEERVWKQKDRTRPTCNCTAYEWPHRPSNGLCRWPLDSLETYPTPAGKRANGKLRRRKVRATLRRYGL